jgi:hypothetical protein
MQRQAHDDKKPMYTGLPTANHNLCKKCATCRVAYFRCRATRLAARLPS